MKRLSCAHILLWFAFLLVFAQFDVGVASGVGGLGFGQGAFVAERAEPAEQLPVHLRRPPAAASVRRRHARTRLADTFLGRQSSRTLTQHMWFARNCHALSINKGLARM